MNGGSRAWHSHYGQSLWCEWGGFKKLFIALKYQRHLLQ